MLYIIYKLLIDDYVYIGSTKNFNKRKSCHKCRCLNIKYKQNKLYETIRENGGWDKCEMLPVEEYECATQLEARIREEYYRNEYDAKLNTNRAYLSKEQKNILKREHYQKYPETKYAKIICDKCNGSYMVTNKSRHFKMYCKGGNQL